LSAERKYKLLSEKKNARPPFAPEIAVNQRAGERVRRFSDNGDGKAV